MGYLVQTGNYVAINTSYTNIMVYYVIKYVSGVFTLQEDTNIDIQVSKSG